MENLERIKEEIQKTGYLENRKMGGIYHQKYPELTKKIKELTKDLDQTRFVNTYFRSRVIFIFKYENNIDNIRVNETFLTFDRKKDDFIDNTGDYVKRGWDKIKKNTTKGFFTFGETINFLKEDDYYKKFLGKARNRTMMKENPILYNSIFKHTKNLNNFNQNYKKFSTRILFLINSDGNLDDIKCKKCKKNFTSFNSLINYFNPVCKQCFNFDGEKYPRKKWFIKRYVENWEQYYLEYRKQNALKLSNFNNGFSKISQQLFWSIYDRLDDDEKQYCYFKELNNEWYINDSDGFHFIDFKFKNKIIEYDGIYWHPKDNEKDIKRNEIYKKNGFKILLINENNYSEICKNIETIEECIKFLRNED